MLRLTLIALGFLTNTAWASEAATRTPELATGSVAMQVLSGLGVVTCAIFGLAWVAKRLGGAKLMQHNGMNIVATMALGTREKIVLLKVNNTNILLGVTAQNISSLHVFDADPELDEITQSESAGQRPALAPANGKWDFAHYIKQFTNPGLNLREMAKQAQQKENLTSIAQVDTKEKGLGH